MLAQVERDKARRTPKIGGHKLEAAFELYVDERLIKNRCRNIGLGNVYGNVDVQTPRMNARNARVAWGPLKKE